MDSKEIRMLTSSVEVRQEENKPPRVEGYAAVFNDETTIGGQFAERVAPGAFRNADMDNTVALFNHNINQPLARVGHGLELTVDERGLRYSFEVGSQSYAKDLVENIRMGNVSTSSFGFTVRDDEWEKRDGELNLRTIKEVGLLFDVSPTTQGAYPTTDVGLRSMEAAIGNEEVALIEEEEIRAEEEEEEENEERPGHYKEEEDEEEMEEKDMEEEEEEEEEERTLVEQLVDPAILPHPYAIDTTPIEPEARNSNNKNPENMDTSKNAPAYIQALGDKVDSTRSRYDFGKALQEACQGRLTGLEAEMNQEARGEFTDSKVNVSGGINVPSMLFRADDAPMGTATVSSGSEAYAGTPALPRNDGGVYAALQPNSIDRALGFRNINNVKGSVVFQVYTTPMTAANKNEGIVAEVENGAFTARTLNPERISAVIQITDQLMAQTTQDFGSFMASEIRRAVDAKFNSKVQAAIDTAAGTEGTYAAATNNALHLEEALLAADVPLNEVRFLADPQAYRAMRQLSLDAGSGMLYATSPNDRQTVLGYQGVISSSQGTGKLHMFSNQQFVTAQWGGMNLVVDPYTYADQGVVQIVANLYKSCVGLDYAACHGLSSVA